MAVINWKNITSDASAGTGAFKNAGAIFDRAFKGLEKTAAGIHQSNVEGFNTERKANTDAFGSRLAGAKTPDEVKVITEEIANLNPDTNIDTFGLTKAANAARQRIQGTSDAALTRNYLKSSRENNLNRARLANQQTQLQVDEDNRQNAIRDYNSNLLGGSDAATQDIISGKTSVDDAFKFLTAANKENVRLNKLSPAEEKANFQQLREAFGLTNEKIVERALNSGELTKGPDGKIDQAQLYNLTKKYLGADALKSGLGKLKEGTGVAAAERAATKRLDRQAKIDDQLTLMKGKFEIGFADPAKRNDLINSVIESDTFDIIGTTSREDAFNALNAAFTKGLNTSVVLDTLGKYAKSSSQGNFDLTGFNKEILKLSGTKALEKNINQEDLLQRQLDQLNNAL